jgi:hypothetical protein
LEDAAGNIQQFDSADEAWCAIHPTPKEKKTSTSSSRTAQTKASEGQRRLQAKASDRSLAFAPVQIESYARAIFEYYGRRRAYDPDVYACLRSQAKQSVYVCLRSLKRRQACTFAFALLSDAKRARLPSLS